MEEEKAAAYYDELTRKGEGAARFKQGLGFSSSDNVPPAKGSALPSSSSFLSNFVRASSPTKASEFQKQAQLESIQNKLKKKPVSSEAENHAIARVSDKIERERDRHSRRRSRSRERHRDRDGDRDRDRDRDRGRDRDRDRDRGRGRDKDMDRDRDRDREDRDRERERRRISVSPRRDRKSERRRSRSLSPRERVRDRRRSEKSRSEDGNRNRDRDRVDKVGREKNGGIAYSKLIEGYENMTPAERVKAKMKLQLTETADKDTTKVMGSGWERFEFNKDAPLDDEEIEVAEDDAALVKNIGQSFRFSAFEARREEQLKAAHDGAMFGVPSLLPYISAENEPEVEDDKKESNENGLVASLLSEKVLAKQQGSWRDRARKV